MNRIRQTSQATIFLGALFLAGCASQFPQPSDEVSVMDGPSGSDIFNLCLEAHGGDLRNAFSEVRLAVTGEWGTLIKRIQPLVSDTGYRIDSNEVYWIQDDRSRIEWTGPDGTKVINWKYPEVEVSYNGVMSTDPDVLASSALTSSTFALFHLGPSFLAWHGGEPTRLADEVIDGRSYHRLYFELEPGFGLSEKDSVVAYVDSVTKRLFRVWLTLEGFRTTMGATVDVTYLDYKRVSGFLMPSKFDERVRSPISIHAHTWWNTRFELVK